MRSSELVLFVICSVGLSQSLDVQLPPITPSPTDMKNTSIKTIIEGLGLKYDSYEVITQDGYILNLNRMINPKCSEERDKGIPVLFLNGMQMYSESWFVQNKPELNIPVAYLLRRYDVWLGDQRGTARSNRHVNMTDDKYDFWDFSFHETGVYDLPAFIDFILNKTKHHKIAYVGLSLGATFFYVLCSEKPEYQDKLYGAVLFQPLGGAPNMSEMATGTRAAMKILNAHMHLQKAMKIGPSLPHIRRKKILCYLVCKVSPFAVIASLTGLTIGAGCQFESKNYCAHMANALGGTSVRTLIHTFQQFKNGGKLTRYDWGAEENMKRYGTGRPPEYDVSKVKAFVAVYVSDTDEYTPTRTVVPFVQKFCGPTYVCRYPDVCHVFTVGDNRMKTYIEDSATVLDSMTGRTNSSKMYLKTCKIDPKDISISRNSANQHFITRTKDLMIHLLPGFISQLLQ